MTAMLDKTLYVALGKLLAPKASLGPVLAAHLDFMVGLEQQGVLFASGPFFDAQHVGTGEGMTILRAASLDAAREILMKDPFVVAGLRTFELHEWHLMEGALNLTVYASQQRGAVP